MTASGPRRSSRLARLSPAGPTEERTAAGIYGVIVSAAVMAASHAKSAVTMIIAVLVTLVIYWSAEHYARLVAERIHAGHRPSWRHVRRQLGTGWEVVTASGLPLGVLALLSLLGVELGSAVLWALGCSTVLLGAAGWEIGRRGQLEWWERIASAVTAAAFGAAMILLKSLLH